MMKLTRVVALALAVLVSSAPVRGQDTTSPSAPAPPVATSPLGAEPARDILNAARGRAAVTGNNILVLFRASWCPWCRRLESVLLDDPVMGKILAAHYEIVRLNVRERDKKHLEHPGGGILLDAWGGAASGVPFYVVLDASGSKLTDSNRLPKQQNIAYPTTSDDMDALGDILATTAPRMMAAERARIIAHMQSHVPKQ